MGWPGAPWVEGTHMEVAVGGGHLSGVIRDRAYEGNIWKVQGSGDISAEEGEGNMHMEVAVSGGPIRKDQGHSL